MQRIPQLAFVLETIAGEVISAVQSGFSGHLPRSRQVHARYHCRVNLTEYGECEYPTPASKRQLPEYGKCEYLTPASRLPHTGE